MTESGKSEPVAAGSLGKLGDYRLLRVLGEGAAGQVFLAKQQQPLRQVAIKVLRSASSLSRARFEREVDLLARLEHTNIARLYDSGTETGPTGQLPYLVMEYVQGHDLIRYADAQQLNMEQRLALLAQVARAAHFAHTRGVIHRDLKPGNILVNERGEPKILDFGIAHVVADEATQMTGAGEVLGTLSYMSWEQLCGDGHLVDARADVYALGVIGYQLISGQQPYPGLTEETLVGALGRLQREAPQKLSAHRAAAAGDVETIIGKAMSREAGQRYGSAAEFAADIERFLRQQPIEARPPTLSYVVGLFVRRHKALSSAIALTAVSLLAAVGVSLSFAVSESRARQFAEQRLDERVALTSFLTDMLASADPEISRGSELSVLELIDASALTLNADKDLPANVRREVLATLGGTYGALGQHAKAVEALTAARTLAATDAERQPIDITLAFVRLELGQPEKAQEILDDVVGAPAAPELGLQARRGLARALADQSKLEEAERVLRAVIHEARSAGAAELLEQSLYDLTVTLNTRGQYEESLAYAIELTEQRHDRLGADHPKTMTARSHLGTVLEQSGNLLDARAELESVVADQRRVLPVGHPSTLTSMLNLSNTLAKMGEVDAGIVIAKETSEGLIDALGPAHPKSLAAMNVHAYLAEEKGDLADAERVLREIRQTITKNYGAQHPENLAPLNNLAMLLMKRGDHLAAAELFKEVIGLATGLLGEDHPYVAIFRSNYGECLTAMGDWDEARTQLLAAQPILDSAMGKESARSEKNRARLAQLSVAESK